MNNMKAKLKKQGGFTLIEMLIVVAIIAILIAISIPIIGTALERARHAVDQANERSAAALGNIILLTYTEEQVKDTGFTQGTYDAATHTVTSQYVISTNGSQGSLAKTSTSYGKCTGAGIEGCTSGGRTGQVIEVTINYQTGVVTTDWK